MPMTPPPDENSMSIADSILSLSISPPVTHKPRSAAIMSLSINIGAAAAPATTPGTAAKGRPLPGAIHLPPVKKQRTLSEDEDYDEDAYTDVEEDDDQESTTRPVDEDVTMHEVVHNTPSPAFFAAAATTPSKSQRLTTNPQNPLPPYLTRIRHAKQLVIITSDPKHSARPYKTGKEMDVIEVIEDGGMVIDHDGLIVAVGTDAEIAALYDVPVRSSPTLQVPTTPCTPSTFAYLYELDATDMCILPGLVDGHTHPVWAGDRVHEFKMKLAGASYMDIHKSGGGIGFTVQHTRQATERELLISLLQRLDRALRQGTTLLEAKSGYGLELATELKMLKVIQQAHDMQPIELVGNFCGAHSVPKGSTASEATQDVIHKQLPAIMAAKTSLGLKTLQFIDVFCEKGVFELEDTRSILKAGQDAGLLINFHGDELSAISAAELGAELHATAVSHLEHISDAGMKLMATQGVVATLLPTTAYVLRIKPPPAKKMIECGVPVALGSDFNPNAHSLSMPFTMNLACVYMGMTLPQALNAATINAAGSLNRAHLYGSFAKGKIGDFIMLDAPSWEHLIYQMIDPPIVQVWKKGRMVWKFKDGLLTAGASVLNMNE